MPKTKKPDPDLSCLKEVNPGEEVLVTRLTPTLVTQFKDWRRLMDTRRILLFKMADKIYGKTIERGAEVERADKLLQILGLAYRKGCKDIKPELAEEVAAFAEIEGATTLQEMQFWHKVRAHYKLWLRPYLAVREGFALVEIPTPTVELKDKGQA
jgi:hypothetical protein